MKEYIEREAAIRAVTPQYAPAINLALINMIQRVPAADVRPVVRGLWITGSDNPRDRGRIRSICPNCRAFALYEFVNVGSYKEKLSNFCPDCGADLRRK